MSRWGNVLRIGAGIAALTLALAVITVTALPRLRSDPAQVGIETPLPELGGLPTREPPAASRPTGASTPVADPVYPDRGNPNIDIYKYDLKLTWSPGSRLLTGRALLTLRTVAGTGEISLDFAREYRVDRAAVNGQSAPARWRNGDLVIAAPRWLAPDELVNVSIDYRGTPATAPFPGVRTDIVALGTRIDDTGALWSMQEPYGAFTWFPCNDQPSDKAFFDVRITAPPGWFGVSSGELVSVTTGPSGASVTQWRGAAPSATYLLAFAVDRFVRFTDTGPHGLPVTYWVRPSEATLMVPLLRRVPRMLSWLERHLGRYPFSSIGVVVVPDRSAMETQTMITIGPFAGHRGETVLLHELAHQWFGNAVTPSTWRDLWLNEGFATYVEMLYAVDQLDADQAETLRIWRVGDAPARKRSGPPFRYDPLRFAEYNVYYGPALLLHEIRRKLGDSLFFAMFHDWVQHHLHQVVDRGAFETWLERYGGANLGPLVSAWLDSPATPAAAS